MNTAIALNILADSMDKLARQLDGRNRNHNVREAYEASRDAVQAAFEQVCEDISRVREGYPEFRGLDLVLEPKAKYYRAVAIDIRAEASALPA